MGLLLLALALMTGLCLIPLGLPGIWVLILAAVAYGPLTGTAAFGALSLAGMVGLGALAEGLEFLLSGHFTRQYGGSRRAAWGAILGGLAGAVIGIPVPIIGSMLGAFAGAFAGAWLLEISRGTGQDAATRVATGALLGRVAAVAAKTGLGFVIAVWVFGQAALTPAPQAPPRQPEVRATV